MLRSVTSSPTSATNTKQSWICTFNGAAARSAAPAPTRRYTLPPNLVTHHDSVVISEVTYAYKPLVFDYFMKKLRTSGGTPAPTPSPRRST